MYNNIHIYGNGWICHGTSLYTHTNTQTVTRNYMDGLLLLLLYNIVQ